MITKPTRPTSLAAPCPFPSPTARSLVQDTPTPGLAGGSQDWSATTRLVPIQHRCIIPCLKPPDGSLTFLLSLASWNNHHHNLSSASSHFPYTFQLSQTKLPQGFLSLSPCAIHFVTQSFSPVCSQESSGSLSSLHFRTSNTGFFAKEICLLDPEKYGPNKGYNVCVVLSVWARHTPNTSFHLVGRKVVSVDAGASLVRGSARASTSLLYWFWVMGQGSDAPSQPLFSPLSAWQHQCRHPH